MLAAISLCEVKPRLCLAADSDDSCSSFAASVERLFEMSDILTQLPAVVRSMAASDICAAVCLTGSG